MKKVHFDPHDPIVHTLYVWPYASQAARHGEWEQMARDRERFTMRIQRLSEIISPILAYKIKQYKTI